MEGNPFTQLEMIEFDVDFSNPFYFGEDYDEDF
jgi:hypothetical protein